jgi:eukaryotic-like serine/threonine-protein kinase
VSIENYGNYQLLKRLATGGMAQIYLARQQGMEGFEKLLVVKRILPHLAENEDFVRMFLDEARIAARLNHPNIVQIFNLGAEAESYFIAMEYIHGEDVRRVWKRAESHGKTFPIPLVCRVIMDACSGLDHAHKKTDSAGRPLGIVHRDVSPQNILITFDGAVKVVDFGIAKATDQATVTKSGVLKGKYSYMSPEQAAGKRLDARSDIFALGVVLYELLTGTRLFKRHNEIQTLNAVTACRVQPPSEVNARLPKDLDGLVLKALAKNPDERYQDALALHDALERWLLSHQLPSSPSHLAAFMQEIYAERLAREARDGRLSTSDLEANKDDASPKNARSLNGRGRLLPRMAPPAPNGFGSEKDLTLPMTTHGAAKALQGILSRVSDASSLGGSGATHVSDPSSKLDPVSATERRPGESSWRTRPLGGTPGQMRRRSWKWPVAIAMLLLLAGGVSAYVVYPRLVGMLQEQAGRATVRVLTEPEGATVVFNGKIVSQPSPCTLPPVPPGTYALLVGKNGFKDHRSMVEVPVTGERVLPTIRLEPFAAPAPESPKQVTLTLRSEPTGADVLVSGTLRGKTPLAMELPAGGEISFRLQYEGHQSVERELRLTEEAFQTELVTLEKTQVASKEPASPPSGAQRLKPLPVSILPVQPMGMVRFAVTPWAEVTCGSHRLGSTPFEDRRLPAGVYECVFRNPQLGVRTERVEIKPDETSRVTVNFSP